MVQVISDPGYCRVKEAEQARLLCAVLSLQGEIDVGRSKVHQVLDITDVLACFNLVTHFLPALNDAFPHLSVELVVPPVPEFPVPGVAMGDTALKEEEGALTNADLLRHCCRITPTSGNKLHDQAGSDLGRALKTVIKFHGMWVETVS